MKYHYKSPEQLKKEIEEHIRKNKTSPYSSKAIQIMFLNILLIVVVFVILDRTGTLKKIYKNQTIPEIQYDITNALNLYFKINKTIILVDSSTKPDSDAMIQLLKIEMDFDQKIYEMIPEFPKTILDQNHNVIRFPLPEHINPSSIKKVFITISNQRIEVPIRH